MSQLTLFDYIRQESSAHKRPRTESTEDSASASTSANLEVHSSTTNTNTSNLELVDPNDYDTTVGVSSPISGLTVLSTSNEDPSTDSTQLSSSVAHDSGAAAIPTVSKESADNKNSNAVLATSITCAGDIALSPGFPPVQPKSVFNFQPQHSLIEPGHLTQSGMIHIVGLNILLNMMLVFAIHAAFLAHRMVVSVVGQSQHLL